MRKPLVVFVLIFLSVFIEITVSAPIQKKSLRAQLNPNYLLAMAAYKRLEPKLTGEELRAITVIGILNGAKHTEQKMKTNLIEILKDLIEKTEINDQKSVLLKIERIDRQVLRDQHALEVLTKALDLAAGKLSAKNFRKEMQYMLQEVRLTTDNDAESVDQLTNETAYDNSISQKIAELRQNIMNQMDTMKQIVGEKVENTLKHIINQADKNGLIAEASEKIKRDRRDVRKSYEPELPAEVRLIDSILREADFRSNLVEDSPKENHKNDLDLNDLTRNNIENSSGNKTSRKKRILNNNSNSQKNNNKVLAEVIQAVVANITANRTTENEKPSKQETDSSLDIDEPAKQEEDFPDDETGENGGGGGGLVGIITGLSGGEGGSDVGALIGALTGLISTLFGPGGLDVDSLIGTGTSLIAGLLGGNKNFGTVLGMYVGTALDGLSGGGGAINNGQFIGNFLGTVIASLSADPEEEGPVQPLVFAENLINSFLEAKNRKASGEESGEGPEKPQNYDPKNGGSDSGGFIKSIVSHIVSTAISVVLNASLGAVGGASQASSSLFSSSSHKPH